MSEQEAPHPRCRWCGKAIYRQQVQVGYPTTIIEEWRHVELTGGELRRFCRVAQPEYGTIDGTTDDVAAAGLGDLIEERDRLRAAVAEQRLRDRLGALVDALSDDLAYEVLQCPDVRDIVREACYDLGGNYLPYLDRDWLGGVEG